MSYRIANSANNTNTWSQNNGNYHAPGDSSSNSFNASLQYDPFPAHGQQWQVAELLQERLNSLNHLVKTRESLIHVVPDSENQNPPLTIANEHNSDESQNEDGEVESSSQKTLGSPHPLSEKITFTSLDASRRLSLRFEDYQDEDNVNKQNMNSKLRNQGSNRVIVNGRDRRKKSIQRIEKQLLSNSSRYLSRAANSIRFCVKKVPSEESFDKSKMIDKEEYPIPVGGTEMNPDLLMSLSCEKMALEHGRGLLKKVSLDPTSLELFVYMYWFIHCRFFQKFSSSEQRYLLAKVANVFPRFIKLLTSLAPPKERDMLFRHYPFVLSKAIYLGFQFLCPGNQKLFKGPFLRILYLSVSRLLTGVDICPESVDALRLKLFPEDGFKDGCDEEDKERSNRLCPLPSGENYRRMNGNDINAENKMRNVDGGQCLHDKRRNLARAYFAQARNSVVKFMGERETLRFHNEKPVSLGCKFLPRQQQVNFDVNQISPLLQHCLGRENISLRPKHFIKRTEPVRFCKTGGIETFHRRYNDNIENEREAFMIQHTELKGAMKSSLLQNDKEFLKARSLVADRKALALKTKETIEESASSIIDNLGNQKQCQS